MCVPYRHKGHAKSARRGRAPSGAFRPFRGPPPARFPVKGGLLFSLPPPSPWAVLVLRMCPPWAYGLPVVCSYMLPRYAPLHYIPPIIPPFPPPPVGRRGKERGHGEKHGETGQRDGGRAQRLRPCPVGRRGRGRVGATKGAARGGGPVWRARGLIRDGKARAQTPD